MKVKQIETYQVPGEDDAVETYERHCVVDSGCVISAYGQLGNDVTILRNELVGDVLDREVLVHPHPSSLPVIVRTFAGADIMDCVQRTVYDFRTHQGEMVTSMVERSMQGKFHAKSGLSLRVPAPDAPRTVTWTQDTKVRVGIPLVGGLLAKAICSELKARSPKLEALQQAWLDAAVAREASDDALPEGDS